MKHQQSCTPNTGNGGNFYSFGATSAGKNVSAGEDTTSSICPRGWTLVEYSGNKSFINLTTIYLRIKESTSGLASTVEAAFRRSPSSFVRSGVYSYTTSTLNNRDSVGGYWSSRANSAANACYLYFDSTNILPQYNSYKGSGFALRCVAR